MYEEERDGARQAAGGGDWRNAVEDSYRDSKKRNRTTMILTVVIIVGVLIYTMVTGQGAVVANLNDTQLGVVGADGEAVVIEYSAITLAELVEELDVGTAVTGTQGGNTYSGVYNNSAYGDYTLFAYTNVQTYIVVHHADGVLVFNSNREDNTRSIYEELAKNLSA